VTVSGVETIWKLTIDYVVWQSSSLSKLPPVASVANTAGFSTNMTVFGKRDILAPATAVTLPPYASACSLAGPYKSACSCRGVNVTPSPMSQSDPIKIFEDQRF